MPPQPRTPLDPTGNISVAEPFQIINLPAGYGYLHTSIPCAESFPLDASAQDSLNINDFDPDMLTDEETVTG
jgi:hypothetical protein